MHYSDSDSGPRPAERARTALAEAPTLTVEIVDGGAGWDVVDVRAVDTDGSLLLLVGVEGELACRTVRAGVPVSVHGARPIPLVGPDRALDTVTLFGTAVLVDADALGDAMGVLADAYPGRSAEVMLRPDASALLRVDVTQVRLDAEPVDPVAYRAARVDPIAAHSDGFVSHLVLEHPERVMALAHLLDPALVAAAHLLAPIRVDRHGLLFRLVTGTGATDARLDFTAALRGPEELPAAMQALECRAAQVRSCPLRGEPFTTSDPRPRP